MYGNLSILIHLLACNDNKQNDIQEEVVLIDQDGDGFFAEQDCNDEDDSIHPEADETCDGIDNNCDGKSMKAS